LILGAQAASGIKFTLTKRYRSGSGKVGVGGESAKGGKGSAVRKNHPVEQQLLVRGFDSKRRG